MQASVKRVRLEFLRAYQMMSTTGDCVYVCSNPIYVYSDPIYVYRNPVYVCSNPICVYSNPVYVQSSAAYVYSNPHFCALVQASVKRVRLEFLRAYQIMSTTGDFAWCCAPYLAGLPLFLPYRGTSPIRKSLGGGCFL